MLAQREFRLRYRQSALKTGWAVLTPLVLLGVYGTVLTQSFGVAASCGTYLSSAWTGLVLWTFFATAVAGSATSVLTSSDLVAKIAFPRAAIPLAVTGATLVDLAVGIATLVGLVLVQEVHLTVASVAVLLPLGVLVVWTAAISVVVATLAAFSRDVVHGVGLGLRVGFIFSPVMYEASFVPEQVAWTAQANPVAVAITGARAALLCGGGLPTGLLVGHLIAGAAVLWGALAYTRSIETRIADAM